MSCTPSPTAGTSITRDAQPGSSAPLMSSWFPRRSLPRPATSSTGHWGSTAEAAFLDSVGTGPDYTFQLVELVDSDLRRMSGLVRQYSGLRLGGTDASVVAICERLGIVTVATVNLRDFATVRPRHIPAFITVPGLG